MGIYMVPCLGFVWALSFCLVVQKTMNHFYPYAEMMEKDSSLWRKTGWMMTIAIALHHIPEGIAIGAGVSLPTIA